MGRLCGERGTAQALRASAGRKKRVSPHPAPKHLKPPRTTPKRPRASHIQPTAANPAPSPSLPRIYPRIYVPRPGRFGCSAARVRSCRSRRAPAPATSILSQLTATNPAPSPSLPRIYPRIYVPPPDRFGCPAARVRSCRSRRVPAPAACAVGARPPRTFAVPSPYLRRPFRAYILGYTSLSPTGSDAPPRASAPAAAGVSRPLALRRGQEGSALLPRRKSSADADLFRRPYLGTTAFFIPLTLSMAYRTASMVWLSWSGYRGRTRPLRSRSYS